MVEHLCEAALACAQRASWWDVHGTDLEGSAPQGWWRALALAQTAAHTSWQRPHPQDKTCPEPPTHVPARAPICHSTRLCVNHQSHTGAACAYVERSQKSRSSEQGLAGSDTRRALLHPRLIPQTYGSSTPWFSICSSRCQKSRGRAFTCRGAGMAPADSSTAASLGEVSACTSTSSLPVAFIPLSRATCMPLKHCFLDPGQASSHHIAIIHMTHPLLPYPGHPKEQSTLSQKVSSAIIGSSNM